MRGACSCCASIDVEMLLLSSKSEKDFDTCDKLLYIVFTFIRVRNVVGSFSDNTVFYLGYWF